MTREQLLEGLYKDLIRFSQEWVEDAKIAKSPSGRLYARTRADSYECAANWLRDTLDMETTDEETV